LVHLHAHLRRDVSYEARTVAATSVSYEEDCDCVIRCVKHYGLDYGDGRCEIVPFENQRDCLAWIHLEKRSVDGMTETVIRSCLYAWSLCLCEVVNGIGRMRCRDPDVWEMVSVVYHEELPT
jgi:hypothetical protein